MDNKKTRTCKNRIYVLLLSACLLFVPAALSGCRSDKTAGGNSGSGRESADISDIFGEEGKKTVTAAISSDTGTLDPAGNIALTYLTYSASALDGLLTFDSDGNIEYRAAESYEVNEERTVYTFHLRKDAVWSDGTPVTSSDFLNTIRRALDPASGSGYANYLFPIRNAEEIYGKEKEMDSLGVKTPDKETLVFYLKEPCPYFPELLQLPVYTPSCAKYADSVESGWYNEASTSVSNGPFCLAEYVPDQYLILKKNEYYWNRDEINLDGIVFRFFDDSQAMVNAYEAGDVDIAVSLPSTVMQMYEGEEDLYVTELIATRYIYFNLEAEPFDDVRVRKAFNLAVNREDLCKIVGSDTEPAYNLVAKYMKDKNTGQYFVDGAEQPFEENVKEARRLLAEAGYPDGEGFPEITYSYPTLEMDSDTAQVIQEQLKKNLNIEIRLNAQELQANYAARRAGDFDLCRMNWTADFADPYTYLSMLLTNSTYNCSGIADAEYDRIISQANSSKDSAARMSLLHEAEQLAVGEKFYIIPLYTLKSVNLVAPKITGITRIPASGALEYRYIDIK